jgi:RNA polymerase-binding transcription factor DksA
MDVKAVVADASILELRELLEEVDRELRERSFTCPACGQDIPTARPLKHPAHAPMCLRYASMVTY